MSQRNTTPAFAIGGIVPDYRITEPERRAIVTHTLGRRSETRSVTIREIEIPEVMTLDEGLAVLMDRTRAHRVSRYTDPLGRAWMLFGYKIAGGQIEIYARDEWTGDQSTFTLTISA